jgi:hypothetical protein
MARQEILGPDIFVNASVALGSPPEHVVRRMLGLPGRKAKGTRWIVERVEAMLRAVPDFKAERVGPQMELIRGLVELIPDEAEFAPEAWEKALVSAAKAAGASRVITDHPDLLEKEVDGVEFVSSEAWLLEKTTPPPPPVG